MPHQIVQRQRLLQLDLVLPPSISPGYINLPLGAAQHVVFRIQNFRRQLSGSGAGSMVSNGQVQQSMRIGCDGSRRAAGRLEWPQNDECCDRQKYSEDENKESCRVSALIAVVHVISVKIRRLFVDTHCHPGST